MSLGSFRGDLYGGITAAVIALPLALAFGVASGLGPAAGLYGAIIVGFFASFLGGTPTQISGPTGPMTIVVASALAVLGGNIPAVMATFLLAGIFQIIFGFIGVGKFFKYIPYPVISGFMSGIGIIIIILQINPFLGAIGLSSPLITLYNLPETIINLNLTSLIFATSTLLILYLTPKKIAQFFPPALIALVTLTSIGVVLNLDIRSIGNIPNSLPSFIFPEFSIINIKQILTLGVTLAVLGSIDTLLTSLVADSITKTKHNPNKELIGQGIGNALCSFFGGLVGAGATMRTVINVKTGAKTNISGMLHSLVLLAVLLGLGSYAQHIPMSVLAGILVKVGIDILDYKMLKIIKHAPKYDLYVMIVVFVLTVFVDLIMAVGAGITLASFLITYRLVRRVEVNVSKTHTEEELDQDHKELHQSIRTIKVDGAFFFGTAREVVSNVDAILETKVIIIDLTSVPFMDLSAIFAFEETLSSIMDKDIQIVLVFNKNKKIFHRLSNLNIIKNIDNENKLFDYKLAVDRADIIVCGSVNCAIVP